MERLYINTTHNENCQQIYTNSAQDVAALMRAFWADAAEDVTCEPSDDHTDAEPLTRDDKIGMALNAVIADGLIKHAYDYHIVRQVLREKFNVKFDNGQSFVNYLTQTLGVTHMVPSADNLNTYSSKMKRTYPDYSWVNTDHSEEVRRNNLAKSFYRELKLKGM